jgi:hypothetical protein
MRLEGKGRSRKKIFFCPLFKILLRSILFTHVQGWIGSTVKMVFSYKIFTSHEANTGVGGVSNEETIEQQSLSLHEH